VDAIEYYEEKIEDLKKKINEEEERQS